MSRFPTRQNANAQRYRHGVYEQGSDSFSHANKKSPVYYEDSGLNLSPTKPKQTAFSTPCFLCQQQMSDLTPSRIVYCEGCNSSNTVCLKCNNDKSVAKLCYSCTRTEMLAAWVRCSCCDFECRYIYFVDAQHTIACDSCKKSLHNYKCVTARSQKIAEERARSNHIQKEIGDFSRTNETPLRVLNLEQRVADQEERLKKLEQQAEAQPAPQPQLDPKQDLGTADDNSEL
jgi:hypothetical protein